MNEYEAEEKYVAEHWSQGLEGVALVAVIETKIVRAVLAAEKRQREKLVKQLEDRMADYISCNKDDNCKYMAQGIHVAILDIMEELD